MKERIHSAIDASSGRFKEISRYIGENPELGHEEFKAFERLTEELEFHGFQVERAVLDIPTAFFWGRTPLPNRGRWWRSYVNMMRWQIWDTPAGIILFA